MADNASPAQPKSRSAGDVKPQWKTEAQSKRELFKEQQRNWRAAEAQKRLDELEAGERKFKVAIHPIRNDGTTLPHSTKVLRLGQPVDYLEVGASSEIEAKEKFAKYNGIRGVPQQIYVVA